MLLRTLVGGNAPFAVTAIVTARHGPFKPFLKEFYDLAVQGLFHNRINPDKWIC
jgi:hypothetical protein